MFMPCFWQKDPHSRAGLCWALSFLLFIFLLYIHAPTPPPTHTSRSRPAAKCIVLLVCLACTVSFSGNCAGHLAASCVLSSCSRPGWSLELGCRWTRCRIPRAHTRTPERSELPGGPQVTQPGREAGTACGYSELEGRERTAAACVPGPLYGDTKQIGSPHTVQPPWRQRASKAPVGPTLFPQLCRTQVWGRSKQPKLPLNPSSLSVRSFFDLYFKWAWGRRGRYREKHVNFAFYFLFA